MQHAIIHIVQLKEFQENNTHLGVQMGTISKNTM